jgi:hypothetical protein
MAPVLVIEWPFNQQWQNGVLISIAHFRQIGFRARLRASCGTVAQ